MWTIEEKVAEKEKKSEKTMKDSSYFSTTQQSWTLEKINTFSLSESSHLQNKKSMHSYIPHNFHINIQDKKIDTNNCKEKIF